MKNAIKKIGMLFAVIIMTVLCTVSVSAETWGDYEYEVLEDGTVEITRYNGNATEVTIPSEINGKSVTSIGICAFWGRHNLKDITIPNSVVHVGRNAFFDTAAYIYAKNNIINGMIIIDDCLLSVVSDYVIIPQNIRVISDGAFDMDRPVYKFFEVDSNNKFFSSDEYGVLYNKDKTELICYPNASKNAEYVIPETVNAVRELRSFYLEVLVVPSGIKEITDSSFVMSLKDVYIHNDNFDMNTIYFAMIDQGKWFEIREEFSEWCEEYVARLMNGTITDEFVDEFSEYYNMAEEYIWSGEPILYITIHAYKGSTAEAYAKESGINFAEIKEEIIEDIVVTDKNTGIQAEYDSSVFDSEVEFVVSEDGANADIVFADKYENYKSYDVSFLFNGETVQPNGKVIVKLPVPVTFNEETIAVYYVDNIGNKTKLDSKVEDGFVIFETDHFSCYAIVDESSKIEEPPVVDDPVEPDEPDTPDEPIQEPEQTSKDCSCKCHKGGIAGFFWKIANFFNRLFKIKSKQMCTCGIAHY